MKFSYKFTIAIPSLSFITSKMLDALHCHGCKDAYIRRNYDMMFLTFIRPAETEESAIMSAIYNILDSRIVYDDSYLRVLK